MEDILYTYHGQLYVNLTNQCPCACTFCICSQTRAIGSAQDLWLKHDPSVEEVKAELTSQGIAFENVEQGIMIETPAAVMVSEALAKEVDFFSIGTNDLTQYTLAIDRQNPKLEDFYDPHHPAVLNMIRMTVENAHKAGIWAGICGELGADPELTKLFLSIGVDELSVSPSRVLSVRKTILETDVSKERDEQIKKWL